jgi:hypothetical protein
MRGCAYSHDGPCEGDGCARCYKYACARCGERSNLVFSCLFCHSKSPDQSGAEKSEQGAKAEVAAKESPSKGSASERPAAS